MRRPWQFLQFQLEQFIIRGPFHRLLLMAGIIAAIAAAGGVVVFIHGDIGSPSDAVWWAFLRLTDPGYLGDDEGIFKRFISTIITVLGYVVFMGALIAIMTQWFHTLIARIESGTSPVSLQNHFVVLGWTNRTAAIVEELLRSDSRVRSFYERLGYDDALRVAILSNEPVTTVREELRHELRDRYDPEQVIVRKGTALRPEHLMRVDFLRAAAVVVPADPTGVDHSTNLDAITIKTLLSTMTAAHELAGGDTTSMPLVVAELTDERKVHIADAAYQGPLETLTTDRINARLIAQSVRHHGVSAIYQDFLAHSWGNEVYVRIWHGAATSFRIVGGSYRDALPIGVATGEDGALDIELNPPLDREVKQGDRVILLAPDQLATDVTNDDGVFAEVGRAEPPKKQLRSKRRVLVLGWSRKVPVLLGEFDAYQNEHFDIDLMSLVDIEERERDIKRRYGTLDRTTVRHIEADFTSESDLEALDFTRYDTVLIVSSDWLVVDELSDARSLLGFLVLQSVLRGRKASPRVVIELRDAESADLLGGEHQSDVLVSPEMSSHMLCHIALRRELGEVFEELFGPHGAEIFFLPISSYGIKPGRVPFAAIRKKVAAHGECALGVRIEGAAMLNPKTDDSLDLGPDDEVIVLAVIEPEDLG